jgi:hypothetical protein
VQVEQDEVKAPAMVPVGFHRLQAPARHPHVEPVLRQGRPEQSKHRLVVHHQGIQGGHQDLLAYVG